MNDAKPPSLTVGLAVYNGAEFLEETISSVLAQTFTDFELIISDNASTDRTETICRRYAESDKRIRYIRQSENIGGSANFNFLFTEARGKYFKWAAADDLLAPEYLERCVNLLDSHPEYVVCHTQTVTIDPAGNELPNDIVRSSGAAENPDDLMEGLSRPWRRFRGVLLGNGNPVYDTAAVDFYGVARSEALLRTKLLKPHVGYEKVVLARLSLQGRIAEVQEPLFAYRIHPRSVGSQVSNDAQREWSDPQQTSSQYPRIQYLKGYFWSVTHLDMPLRDRLRCILVIGRYVFQIKKWKRVFLASFLGRRLDDGNAEILRQNAHNDSANIDLNPVSGQFISANRTCDADPKYSQSS